MSELDYKITKEEKKILSDSVGNIISSMRDNAVSAQDFENIARCLQVSQDNFEKLKAETWFIKAWKMISGERGNLIDININNLGKIQLGVLKLLGEILEDSSGIKDDLLKVFRGLDAVQRQSLELKVIILKFNQKYSKNFQKLQRDIEETRLALRLSQIVLGICCIAGTALAFVPGLKEQYWQYGLFCGGATGIFLIGQWAIDFSKKRKNPIPVDFIPDVAASENCEAIDHACKFLGVGEPASAEPDDTRVFKINNSINTLMDYFKLSKEEQRLLFSLQHYLCTVDIEKTPYENNKDLRKKKAAWLEAWRQIVEGQLDMPFVTDTEVFFTGLDEVRQEHLSLPKIGTIMLEAALFIPYFPLGSENTNNGLCHNKQDLREQVDQLCRHLGLASYLIVEAEKVNEAALKGIPAKGFFESTWNVVTENPLKIFAGAVLIAITGGLAAPLIGGAIGTAMGLSGCVAVNAGLAFLGGGAIAVGGLGMAGGTAVIIGGGAILGASTAGGLIGLFSNSKYLVVRELAKMEAIAKVFISTLKDGKVIIQEIIESEKKTIKELESAVAEVKDSDRKKQLIENVRSCNKAIARLETFVNEHF